MIKTFKHNLVDDDNPLKKLTKETINNLEQRDREVNDFTNEHGSFAIQTNINTTHIITTIFYGKR